MLNVVMLSVMAPFFIDKARNIFGSISKRMISVSGYYLYVSYEAGSAGIPGYGATLRSPIFPPPPLYNNNNESVYNNSCRVSPISHNQFSAPSINSRCRGKKSLA
jgi:hypothetical protein